MQSPIGAKYPGAAGKMTRYRGTSTYRTFPGITLSRYYQAPYSNIIWNRIMLMIISS